MKRNGFTLIELLVVVTILSILAVSIIVALDPMRQFAQARNAKRWTDINSISTALSRYIIQNDAIPDGITTEIKQIATTETGCSTLCPNASDVCIQITDELKPFLDTFPKDPVSGTNIYSGYTVTKTQDDAIRVSSCNAEYDAVIEITR